MTLLVSLIPPRPWKRNSPSSSGNIAITECHVFRFALSVFRIFWKTDAWEKSMPIPSREPSLLAHEMPGGGEIWWRGANGCASVSRSGVSLRYRFQHTQTFEQDPLILPFVSEPELLQSGRCEGFMIFCCPCYDLMLTSTETLTSEPWVQNRNNQGAEAAPEWAGGWLSR